MIFEDELEYELSEFIEDFKERVNKGRGEEEWK